MCDKSEVEDILDELLQNNEQSLGDKILSFLKVEKCIECKDDIVINNDIVKHCDNCDEFVCLKCYPSLNDCNDCDKKYCNQCTDELRGCEGCDKTYCYEECVGKYLTCGECDSMYCCEPFVVININETTDFGAFDEQNTVVRCTVNCVKYVNDNQ